MPTLPNGGKYPMGKKDDKLTAEGDKVGFFRLIEVDKYILSGHKLYRSSAPGYVGDDKDQKMTVQRAAFLKKLKIDSIISFNHYEYTAEEKKVLSAAGIAYQWVHVPDFQPVAEKDIPVFWEFFKKHKVTLVHCGFGWGRTGTGVAIIQLYSTGGKEPKPEQWGEEKDGNDMVETPEQKALLKKLADELVKGKRKA